MKFNNPAFNYYSCLLLAVAIVLGAGAGGIGCRSAEKKRKLATTLRLHLQTNPDNTDRTMPAVIGQSTPFTVTVEQSPFLTEVYIVNASIVEDLGGHRIFVQFDRQGTWLLEQYTTANKGKRIALFSQFGEARWLGAPVITDRIADGAYTFTPDATLQECERIVEGLLEVAKSVRKNNAR